MSVNEEQLKNLLKSAVVEALEERREFVKEIVEEAIEDLALARAIDEGMNSPAAARSDVLEILDAPQ